MGVLDPAVMAMTDFLESLHVATSRCVCSIQVSDAHAGTRVYEGDRDHWWIHGVAKGARQPLDGLAVTEPTVLK